MYLKNVLEIPYTHWDERFSDLLGELVPELSSEPALRGLRNGLVEARATMHEVMLALQEEHVDALAVTRGLRKLTVNGILTRTEIDQQYTRSDG